MATLVRPFTVKGIDLSGYMVKDADRAIAFYRDVLGLEPARIYADKRGAEYDLPDGSTFGLWGGGGALPFQPSNGILFAVEDVESVDAFLATRSIPVVARFETPVCRMLGIADTEGNVIFFHERKGA